MRADGGTRSTREALINVRTPRRGLLNEMKMNIECYVSIEKCREATFCKPFKKLILETLFAGISAYSVCLNVRALSGKGRAREAAVKRKYCREKRGGEFTDKGKFRPRHLEKTTRIGGFQRYWPLLKKTSERTPMSRKVGAIETSRAANVCP